MGIDVDCVFYAHSRNLHGQLRIFNLLCQLSDEAQHCVRLEAVGDGVVPTHLIQLTGGTHEIE